MDSKRHKTVWSGTQPRPGSPLTGDIETDVCVVGGGIAGVSVAYQLMRAGRRVTLLESRALGAGDTGATTDSGLAEPLRRRTVVVIHARPR